MMDENGLYRVNPERGKLSFSKIEIRDILISMVVLSLAFTIIYRNSTSILNYFKYYVGGYEYICLFLMCFGLVVFSFLLHEFGHKFTAQRAGLWSEYRMYPIGLVITLISSVIGFLFAMPGAVMINGQIDKDTYGKISLAGPIVNIVLSAIGIAACLAFNHSFMVVPMLLMANLNAFLGFFNLLPIPPLDGSKIVSWNIGIYIAFLLVAGLEVLYVWQFMPPLYWA